MKLLCADDNGTIRIILERMFAAMAYDVRFVVNGAEAVEAEQAEKFDVILLDMEMPVLSGLEAARAIRAREAATGAFRTPILFLSGTEGETLDSMTLDAGADGRLVKPFTPVQLMNALANLFRSGHDYCHSGAA